MTDATRGAGDETAEGDAFAALWRAYVHARFPDGPLRQVADYLATSARRPGTVTVDLDPHTVHRLLLAVGLRPAGLRQLLDRLAAVGMVTQLQGRDGEYLGVYTLRLPAYLMTGNRATDPGA